MADQPTFEGVRSATANDFREVARLLSDAATEIEKGDLERVEYVAGLWGSWGHMLVVRHDERMGALRRSQGLAVGDPEEIES